MESAKSEGHKKDQPAEARHDDAAWVDIEARLLEQDHRIFAVAWSFLTRQQWPKGDARRSAALKAIIWNVFSPGTAVVGGTVIVGILTFLAMQSQNVLIAEQLFQGRQNYLEQRQVELFKALYDAKDQMDDEGNRVPMNNVRIRQEAFLEYVKRYEASKEAQDTTEDNDHSIEGLLHGAIQIALNQTGEQVISVKPHLRGAFLNDLNIHDMMLREFDLSGAFLDGTTITDGEWSGVVATGLGGYKLIFDRMILENSVIDYLHTDPVFVHVTNGGSSDFQIAGHSLGALTLANGYHHNFVAHFEDASTVVANNIEASGITMLDLGGAHRITLRDSNFETLGIYSKKNDGNRFPESYLTLENTAIDDFFTNDTVMAIGRSRISIPNEDVPLADIGDRLCVGGNTEVMVAGRALTKKEKRGACRSGMYQGFYQLPMNSLQIESFYDRLSLELIAEDLAARDESVQVVVYSENSEPDLYHEQYADLSAAETEKKLLELGVPEMNITTLVIGEGCSSAVRERYDGRDYKVFVSLVSPHTVNSAFYDSIVESPCLLLQEHLKSGSLWNDAELRSKL